MGKKRKTHRTHNAMAARSKAAIELPRISGLIATDL